MPPTKRAPKAPKAKPPAPRTRRSPEEARALILEATQKLLAEHGPDAVGLKDVARAAGVSHALVSHYFGTYEALVDAAMQARVAVIRAELMQRIAALSGQGPEAWIAHVFDALSDPAYGRLMAWAILARRLEREDFFPRRERGIKQVTDAIEAYFGAQHGGAPRLARDDLEFVVLLVLGAAMGYSLSRSVLWASLGREATPERDAWFRAKLAAMLRREFLGK